MRQDLGELSDIGAVERLVPLAGLDVLDVGCGAGQTSRALAGLGARVVGVEPDPQAASAHRAAPPVPNLRFVEASAEALPAADGSIDGVFFFRSLHHVPRQGLTRALAEAVRVLKPEGGYLYVVEPSVEGSFYQMIRLFHDETEARARVQAALEREVRPRFEKIETCRYLQHPRFADFAALADRFAGSTYNSISRAAIEREAVRERFAAGRTAVNGETAYLFEQPLLVDVYRGARKEC